MARRAFASHSPSLARRHRRNQRRSRALVADNPRERLATHPLRTRVRARHSSRPRCGTSEAFLRLADTGCDRCRRAERHRAAGDRLQDRGAARGQLRRWWRASVAADAVLLVLEQLFPQHQVTGGNAFYCTTKGHFLRNEVALAEPARDAAGRSAADHQRSLPRRLFPAAPAEKACEFCDFRRICGPYERERVERRTQRSSSRCSDYERCHDARRRAGTRDDSRASSTETLVVEAAAGTGKTTALIARIVAVIRSGVTALSRVVAVTFTEKAAGEMKLRLRAELESCTPRNERHRTARALGARACGARGGAHQYHSRFLRRFAARATGRCRLSIPQFAVLDETGSRSAAARSIPKLVRTRAVGSGARGCAACSVDVTGARSALPRVRRLLRACRDLVEYRDFDRPWAFPDFQRELLIDELMLRFRTLGSFRHLALRSRRPLARALGEFRRSSTSCDARERAQVQERDYDALEVELAEFLRSKERTIRASGSGRLYGQSLDEAR